MEEDENEESSILHMAMSDHQNEDQMGMEPMDGDMLSGEDLQHLVDIIDILKYAGLDGAVEMIKYIAHANISHANNTMTEADPCDEATA